MFLCRTGRLCAAAAAPDQALKAAGSFLVRLKANRLKDVTVTARTVGHTFHRALCASVVRPEKQQPDPVHNWDASFGFVTTEWRHLNRVATVAVGLSKSVQRDIIRQPLFSTNRRHNSRGDPGGNVLFTGGCWEVSNRRCSTRAMQTRASSTATQKRKSDEEPADSNKEDVQTLKETSTTSSSEKNSGDTEPEAGKLNKTQQLKKVFKEYGAVGVCFHIGISLMSLGMFYLLVSSGIDMAAILCKVGFSEAVVQSKMAAGTSTFVLAYAIHKLFAPVRISITLVSVPLIVRYFRKTGLFKPPTAAP
ncbi:protein FAM210B, mitochondrial [Parambassis ranga]|uniref:Protein FAM210B, mitochondrial n=1 Tax=Parambassis ranga TaxID=210632 RepID=A0A6P7IB84_9TELE|nr:protein FAM210B, mitochondrial [Parambassis ranga]